jgi:hypothetical protein
MTRPEIDGHLGTRDRVDIVVLEAWHVPLAVPGRGRSPSAGRWSWAAVESSQGFRPRLIAYSEAERSRIETDALAVVA